MKLPLLLLALFASTATAAPPGKTGVSIVGADFHINGQPTYKGRSWKEHRVEGLLMNSRMVQGVFDDLNPETAPRWAYPDTGKWDAERNVSEFIAAMPEWRKHGLLAVTVNFQGGSPEGYSKTQPWETGAFLADGGLRPEFAGRMGRILDAADANGMVVILGYFYFGQDQRLRDEAAVLKATDEATKWVLEGGWRNVLIEVNNECNVAAYDHEILKPARVHELIERVRRTEHEGRRLLVGTSYGGGAVPRENVVRASDFLLLHGNGVKDPARITAMIQWTRAVPGYRTMPLVFNEDDHENFDQPENNFAAAVTGHASWGWFDYRRKGESMEDGYQSPPVNWGVSSPRKHQFFTFLAEITGSPKPKPPEFPKRTATATPPPPVIGEDVIFVEKDGLLAMEAEHFFEQTKSDVRAWHLTSAKSQPGVTPDADPPHLEGASCGSYIEALPDTRRNHEEELIKGENFSDTPGVMAVLSYHIRIPQPGRYRVWLRAYSTGTEDNGVHVGLNDEWPASGQRWQTVEKNRWHWDSKQRTPENHTGEEGKLYLDIPTAGDHRLHLSLREDGFEADKIILARDPTWKPEGMGPVPVRKKRELPGKP